MSGPSEGTALRQSLQESAQSLSKALRQYVIRSGYYANLWRMLVKSGETGLSTSTIAKEANKDHVLMDRILRFCASHNMLNEIREGIWCANQATILLSSTTFRSWILYFENENKQHRQVLPNPAGGTLGVGYDCRTSINSPVMSQPQQWQTQPSFLDVIDFISLIGNDRHWRSAIFLDVGGGNGMQCNLIRQKYPRVLGMLFLQELPHVLVEARIEPGIAKMAHDFFRLQQVKGWYSLDEKSFE